ncbi:MAG: ABC transporter substrate-binding protein [bacterium]
MKRLILLILIFFNIIIFLSACAGNEDNSITIAEQYGLAYAPVQIMKDNKILEKHLGDDVKIRWKKLANTAAIREAMLAGEVDIGFIAIPPFLIGREKGMEWKIITGISMSPLGLMTYKKNIQNLADIGENDLIALPQPGSIQHILLAMAADKEFGDPTRFDDQLITMSHPDGMNALLSKREIAAHFTSPPYLFMESETKGIHQIISGKEAIGSEFTFIVGVCTEDFRNNNRQKYHSFIKSIRQSIDFVNNKQEDAVSILSNNYDLSREEIEKVSFNYMSIDEAKKKYKIDNYKYGFNKLENGEEIYYISNPATGLWIA